ncbi:roadblock/LC7 domain-containing protein [Streptomyces antibioticus]|uniref:roadblock/LC7 domain-containing protein n=1 Tax=Streptomyces antibioticus TaxID=1890 RepID=UPI003D7631EA
MTEDTVAATLSEHQVRQQMAGMLEGFVRDVPRVTHALLVSRDGLKLVDSGMSKDPADKWAATFATLASLCENIPGPHGDKGVLKLAMVEREDGLLFVSIAGTSVLFPSQPCDEDGTVDTVLAVVAEPTADAGTVGFEMGQLVDQFAPYMVAAVRSDG